MEQKTMVHIDIVFVAELVVVVDNVVADNNA